MNKRLIILSNIHQYFSLLDTERPKEQPQESQDPSLSSRSQMKPVWPVTRCSHEKAWGKVMLLGQDKVAGNLKIISERHHLHIIIRFFSTLSCHISNYKCTMNTSDIKGLKLPESTHTHPRQPLLILIEKHNCIRLNASDHWMHALSILKGKNELPGTGEKAQYLLPSLLSWGESPGST